MILSVLSSEEAQRPVEVVDWVEKPLDEGSLFRALDNAFVSRSGVSRVVIVEDDSDLAEVLGAIFARQGVEAFHAHTAWAALELTRSVEPDLLVLDLMLPDGTGFEVADALRRHDRLRTLPLVVYTARDLSLEERERLGLGHTEFLVKGRISPQDFEQRVLGLLDRITACASTAVARTRSECSHAPSTRWRTRSSRGGPSSRPETLSLPPARRRSRAR